MYIPHIYTSQCGLCTGLNPNQLYSFRVRAENSVGLGESSPVQSIRTSPAPPTGAPLNVSIRATGPQSLQLTWKVQEYIKPCFLIWRKIYNNDFAAFLISFIQ